MLATEQWNIDPAFHWITGRLIAPSYRSCHINLPSWGWIENLLEPYADQIKCHVVCLDLLTRQFLVFDEYNHMP